MTTNPPAIIGVEVTNGRSRSSPTTVVDDTEWPVGDFELLSSDSVRFIIPAMTSTRPGRFSVLRLEHRSHISQSTRLTLSTVFQNALGLDDGSERKVTFTDSEYETAAVLRLFLQLVIHGTLVMEGYMPNMKELALFIG